MADDQEGIDTDFLATETETEDLTNAEASAPLPQPDEESDAALAALSGFPPVDPRLNKDGSQPQKPGPKKGKPRTPAQKAALTLAQNALKEKRAAIRQLREEEKRLLREATIAKAQAQRVAARGKATESLAPILSLMSPFLELTRTQQKEIERLRSKNREPLPRRGTVRTAAGRFAPYEGDTTTDFSEDNARQLERPSQKKHRTRAVASKSRKGPEKHLEPEPEADFVAIQRSPTPPPPAPQPMQTPENAAAQSLARFMNDLGY